MGEKKKMRDRALDARLRHDPLDFAEQLTGTSIHDADSPAALLGLVMHIHHAEQKQKMLREADDTCMGDSLDRYLRIIGEVGFEKVFEEKFDGNRDGEFDTYFVFARRDGLILEFDTYWQWSDDVATSVNGGKLYYNWLPNYPRAARHGVTSSGGFRDYQGHECALWVGDHDCREALLHKIDGLEECGSFLPTWAERPSAFWLTNYMETKGGPRDFHARVAEYERLTEQRITSMPVWAQGIIGPNPKDKPMKDELVDRLRGLLAKATPLRWAVTSSKGDIYCQSRNTGHWICQGPNDCIVAPPADEREANATLIVEAVNALPGLLDRIESLTASEARWKAVAEELAGLVKAAFYEGVSDGWADFMEDWPEQKPIPGDANKNWEDSQTRQALARCRVMQDG